MAINGYHGVSEYMWQHNGFDSNETTPLLQIAQALVYMHTSDPPIAHLDLHCSAKVVIHFHISD